MNMFRKSVPKPAPGAGAPKGKDQYVTIAYVADLVKEAFPRPDENGVLLQGNIIFKPGARFEKIYETDESQKASHKFEGDADAGGFLKSFVGTHPGDELAINEFVQNNIEEPVILLYPIDCNTGLRKVVGLPCNPMYLKAEFEDSKDGAKHTLTYEQRRRDRHVAKFYSGEITYLENAITPTTAIALATVSGFVYQLPANTSGLITDISISAIDIAHKKTISIVGSGGSEPATLSGGVSGPVTILLDNGTKWIAYKNAVIHFQVFDAGAITYLKELSRS
ncbi:hypothetical protein [Flavobacterium psychrophilum]|uniref:hypothetical protein n=1 Tax=Flavobacterium psychrophilum TaxID=96345 RepID=UPI000B7C2304|nr:hypothetical protein [Flavobacterium psychrophilum]QCW20051.1 hypothetical protein [Flavobacterium phage FPSV-D15]QCW20759.1 hypothetical protein [Flavobacterium phage FPSV-D35]SNA66298.1 conserved hypothetical protein [Flavobacterium psychrophilum]